MRLILFVVVALAVPISGRQVMVGSQLVFDGAAITEYGQRGTADSRMPTSIGIPMHGCWVANASKVQGRAVWIRDSQPDEWWLQCTLQQRVLAQQKAGALAVVVAIGTGAWPADDLPPVMYGWGIGITIDSTAVPASSWPFFLQDNTTVISAFSDFDTAKALRYWQADVAYVIAFSVLFMAVFVACLVVLVVRLRTLRSQLGWRKILTRDSGFFVLAFACAASAWKSLASSVGAFNQLFPELSYAGYVWLADVGDILLYNMLALFLFSWAKLLFLMDKRSVGKSNSFKVPTYIFIVTYSVLSIASLIAESLAERGTYFRVAVLVSAILYLSVGYAVVGVRLVRMFKANGAAVSYFLSGFVVTFCALLIVVLILNAVLILLIVISQSASTTALALSSAADLVMLASTAVFYLYKLQHQFSSAASHSVSVSSTRLDGMSAPRVMSPRAMLSNEAASPAGQPARPAPQLVQQASLQHVKESRDARRALKKSASTLNDSSVSNKTPASFESVDLNSSLPV